VKVSPHPQPAASYNLSVPSNSRLRAQILHLTVVEHRLPVSARQYARLSGVHTREYPHGHSRAQQQHLLSRKSDNTVKLELPSISSVHARGPVDTWYNNSHYAPKPAVSSERLPSLPQIQSHTSVSSTPSPRGDSISSASVSHGSASSNTSYAASVNGQTAGFKTPSPEQSVRPLVNAQSHQSSPYGNQESYGYPHGAYNSMNQMQSYADVHPPHMSAATAHAPASAAPSGLSHYAYPQQGSMMQPGQHQQYGQPPSGYPPYGYPNGVPSQLPVSSSMNNAMVPSTLQLPGKYSEPLVFDPRSSLNQQCLLAARLLRFRAHRATSRTRLTTLAKSRRLG
jgi:protein SOK2